MSAAPRGLPVPQPPLVAPPRGFLAPIDPLRHAWPPGRMRAGDRLVGAAAFQCCPEGTRVPHRALAHPSPIWAQAQIVASSGASRARRGRTVAGAVAPARLRLLLAEALPPFRAPAVRPDELRMLFKKAWAPLGAARSSEAASGGVARVDGDASWSVSRAHTITLFRGLRAFRMHMFLGGLDSFLVARRVSQGRLSLPAGRGGGDAVPRPTLPRKGRTEGMEKSPPHAARSWLTAAWEGRLVETRHVLGAFGLRMSRVVFPPRLVCTPVAFCAGCSGTAT